MSFSVSSGRAIPTRKQLESVVEDPAFPASWPREKKGMSGGDEFPPADVNRFRRESLEARNYCLQIARRWADRGLHKSVVGRLVKYWGHYEMVCTSCAPGWLNFFALRCHEAADPTIRRIAVGMALAYRNSLPHPLSPGDWHLPYVTAEDRGLPWLDRPPPPDIERRILAFSVARCARVSYLRHGSEGSDPEKDLQFHRRALELGHFSVFEHQARVPRVDMNGIIEPVRGQEGNLPGWIQYRQTLQPNVHTEFDFSVLDQFRGDWDDTPELPDATQILVEQDERIRVEFNESFPAGKPAGTEGYR